MVRLPPDRLGQLSDLTNSSALSVREEVDQHELRDKSLGILRFLKRLPLIVALSVKWQILSRTSR